MNEAPSYNYYVEKINRKRGKNESKTMTGTEGDRFCIVFIVLKWAMTFPFLHQLKQEIPV